MNTHNIIKTAIFKVLVPYFNNVKVSNKKRVLKEHSLSDELNITELDKEVSVLANKLGIDKNELRISYDDNENSYGLVALLSVEETITEKEYNANLKKRVNLTTFNMMYKELTAQGLKRCGCSSSKYKAFEDTSVFDMLKAKDYDRLAEYYTLSFKS